MNKSQKVTPVLEHAKSFEKISKQMGDDDLKLTRRLFFRAIPLVVSAAIAAKTSHTTRLVRKLSELVQDDEQIVEPTLAIKHLLGIEDEASILPGTSHPKFFGLAHPNNWSAAKELVVNGFLEDDVFEYQTNEKEFLLSGDFNRSLIAVGSPTSSALAGLLMEYRPVTDDKELGLRRIDNPVLRMPYEYLLDAEFLNRIRKPERRMIDGRVHEVPAWSIRDTRTNEQYVELDKTVKDVLLLTVVRNFLDKEAFDAGKKIVILGGVHGVGTLASGLIFKDPIVVSELNKKTQNFEDWQALIPITHTKLDDIGTTIPTAIDISKADITPIDINASARRVLLDEFTIKDRAFVAAGFQLTNPGLTKTVTATPVSRSNYLTPSIVAKDGSVSKFTHSDEVGKPSKFEGKKTTNLPSEDIPKDGKPRSQAVPVGTVLDNKMDKKINEETEREIELGKVMLLKGFGKNLPTWEMMNTPKEKWIDGYYKKLFSSTPKKTPN